MKLEDKITRWQARLPENLRRGVVIQIGQTLGLGERCITSWMAHGAKRHKPAQLKEWRYPRDITIAALQKLVQPK